MLSRKPVGERLATLTPEQEDRIRIVERRAIAHFVGQLDDLERAIGMLRMGFHFGWKVLVIIHSKKTIKKYEDILGIQVRELFPEEGPSSYRSVGYQIAKQLDNFWKAVSGEVAIRGRKDITGT